MPGVKKIGIGYAERFENDIILKTMWRFFRLKGF